MLDREAMLQWQRDESKRNRNYRLAELALVVVTIFGILIAAFIERSGQPTIIVNPPPIQVIMPTTQPSTPTPTPTIPQTPASQ